MPIFAYRCDSCGFEKDVLQKRSDPPLVTCPACSRDSFAKRLTAPAFQLKGSGWYVTDFRDKDKGKPKTEPGQSGEAGSAGSAAGAAPVEPKSDTAPAPAATSTPAGSGAAAA